MQTTESIKYRQYKIKMFKKKTEIHNVKKTKN